MQYEAKPISISQSILLLVFLIMHAFSLSSRAEQNADVNSELVPIPQVQEHSADLEIKVGKNIYHIEDPKSDESDRNLFNTMPASEQEAFHNNRRMFLSMVARALGLMKYGFGIGSVVKDKISYKLEQIADERAMSQMREIGGGAYDDFMSARDQALAEKEKNRANALKLTLKEKSHQVVLAFLKGIDRKLWQQAPLFARSNEFGMVAAGGLQLLGGKSDKGWGGIIDFGISIGYNRDEKALAIQIYYDFEKYKSTTMPAVFITGLVGKAGTYIANQRNGELTHEGISYYPPMMPGFSSVTKDNFMTGFSSGLTWPPSPLGDILTYTDQLNQNVVMRLTFSPMTKQFIRIQSSLGLETIKIMATSVKTAISNLKNGDSIINECSMIFN